MPKSYDEWMNEAQELAARPDDEASEAAIWSWMDELWKVADDGSNDAQQALDTLDEMEQGVRFWMQNDEPPKGATV